jgi:hypothetical protein
MSLLRKWTDPSPKTNGTPTLVRTGSGIRVEDAGAVGSGWAGMAHQQCHFGAKVPGACRKGLIAPVGPPTHVEYDRLEVRSPTNKVLLSPSVMSAMR